MVGMPVKIYTTLHKWGFVVAMLKIIILQYLNTTNRRHRNKQILYLIILCYKGQLWITLNMSLTFFATLYLVEFNCKNVKGWEYHESNVKVGKKNPTYGRHQLSQPMRIVGPIHIWRGSVIYFYFFYFFLLFDM